MVKRICPICDQAMKGKHYCPVCRSYVKNPIIMNRDYYLNERHPVYETDCEYHNPAISREQKPQIKKNGSRTDGKAGKRDARIRRQPESNRAQDSAETNRAGLYSGRHWEKGRESGDIVYFDFHCHHVPDFSSVCRYTVYDVCPVEEDMLYIICCSLDEG